MRIGNSFITAGLIGAISMLSVSVYAQTMTASDFVQNASVANLFEINSSKLALKKSQRSDVKTFAQQMIDDHTKTGDKLKSVLASSNSKLQPADKLDTKHERLMDKLTNATDKNFDSQYISMQLDAHKEAVGLFSGYASNGNDPALKDFATQTLPTLKDHLDHVKQLKDNH